MLDDSYSLARILVVHIRLTTYNVTIHVPRYTMYQSNYCGYIVNTNTSDFARNVVNFQGLGTTEKEKKPEEKQMGR